MKLELSSSYRVVASVCSFMMLGSLIYGCGSTSQSTPQISPLTDLTVNHVSVVSDTKSGNLQVYRYIHAGTPSPDIYVGISTNPTSSTLTKQLVTLDLISASSGSSFVSVFSPRDISKGGATDGSASYYAVVHRVTSKLVVDVYDNRGLAPVVAGTVEVYPDADHQLQPKLLSLLPSDSALFLSVALVGLTP